MNALRFIVPRRPAQGSVIAIVLAVIALAAFLLAAFVDRATTEMLVETRAAQEARLRLDARSALEAALAVVAAHAAEDGGLHSPAQGWGEPLAALAAAPVRAGTHARIEVLDESGKPSLPRIESAGLVRLLEDLGVRAADAGRIAEALQVWTRGGGSARSETEARSYAFEDPPHHAPGRPLASFHELAAVAVAQEHFFDAEGRPTELLRSFAQAVSLHDFPAVNLNSATPVALALAGLGAADIARILGFLHGPAAGAGGPRRYFRSVGEARALLGAVPPGFDTTARVLRVRIAVQEGPTVLRVEAVVAPVPAPRDGETATTSPGAERAGALAYPFTLLGLEETLELNAPLS